MLHSKLEEVLKIIEQSRASQSEGNRSTDTPNNIRWKEVYVSDDKPHMESTQFSLALDMFKRENREMKLKCEQLSKQLRSKDIQILNLQTAIEASKIEAQQTPDDITQKCDSLDKYYVEFELCAKLVHKSSEENVHERIEFSGLLEEYRRATNKVDDFDRIMNQQKEKLEGFVTAEAKLLLEVSECKSKILALDSTERGMRDEKDQQAEVIRKLRSTADTHAFEIKQERVLNHKLAESLAEAERENSAMLTAMQDSTTHYTRTVNSLNARIEVLQTSLRANQEQCRELATSSSAAAAVSLPSDRSAPPATAAASIVAAEKGIDIDAGERRGRKRSNSANGDGTSESALKKDRVTTTTAATAAAVITSATAPPAVSLASAVQNCCPVCGENPCGLMVRCNACGQGYHASCSRRSGGCRAIDGTFLCKVCTK